MRVVSSPVAIGQHVMPHSLTCRFVPLMFCAGRLDRLMVHIVNIYIVYIQNHCTMHTHDTYCTNLIRFIIYLSTVMWLDHFKPAVEQICCHPCNSANPSSQQAFFSIISVLLFCFPFYFKPPTQVSWRLQEAVSVCSEGWGVPVRDRGWSRHDAARVASSLQGKQQQQQQQQSMQWQDEELH